MTRDFWEIVGAIAGALSFVFAVYTYMRSRTDRMTETAKTEIYKAQLRNLHFSLTSTLYSIDAIVQLAKQDGVNVETLQNLARVARGNLYSTIKQIEKDKGYLGAWRFGHMIQSQDEADAEPSVKDQDISK